MYRQRLPSTILCYYATTDGHLLGVLSRGQLGYNALLRHFIIYSPSPSCTLFLVFNPPSCYFGIPHLPFLFLLQSRPQDYTPRPHKHSAHRPSRWVPIISKGGEEAGGRRGDGRKNIPRMTKLSSRLAPGTVLRCDWLTDGNSEIASQSQASAAQRHAHSTRAIGESPSSPHPSLLRFFTVFAVRH